MSKEELENDHPVSQDNDTSTGGSGEQISVTNGEDLSPNGNNDDENQDPISDDGEGQKKGEDGDEKAKKPSAKTDEEEDSSVRYGDVHNSVINNILGGVTESVHLRFSRTHYLLLKEKDLVQISDSHSFLARHENVEPSLEVLLQSKISILTSEHKSLKQELALFLASELKKQKQGLNICIVDRLPSNILVDFEKDIFRNLKFRNTVIIFNSPTKWNNQDINDFLQKLNASSKQDRLVTNYITSKDVFLIFTLEKNDKKDYNSLFHSPVTFEFRPPAKEVVIEFLKVNLHQFPYGLIISESQKAFLNSLDKEWYDRIVEQITTLSEARQLCEIIYREIQKDSEWIPDSLTLRPYLQSIKNFKGWFLGDLALDRPAWNFVFSLGLLNCLPEQQRNRIPLAEFELFRDLLVDFLRKKEGVRKGKKYWQAIHGESYLFQKCKAVKHIDPATHRCEIRFADDQYAEEIWEVFFEELSLNVIRILPFLEEQLQNFELKRTAARVMGRIGEMDPPRVLRWMSEWASSSEIEEKVRLGYLLQGVLASGNKFYKSFCKNHLVKIGESGEFNKVWAAIAAYKYVGEYDLPYAMEKISEIADNYLTEPYEMIEKLASRKKWRLHQLFVGFTLKELKDLKSTHDKIDTLIENLQRHEEIFYVIRYTISALCLTIDPASVFREWKRWLDKDKKSLKVFTSRMLLGEKGVLDQLNRQITFLNEETDDWEDWHYMVKIIASGEEVQTDIISFFSTAFQSFDASSPKERLALKDRLFTHFEKWADFSLKHTEAKTELMNFFVRLILTETSLGDALHQKINQWQNSLKKKNSLKPFAGEILAELNHEEQKISDEAKSSLRKLFE